MPVPVGLGRPRPIQMSAANSRNLAADIGLLVPPCAFCNALQCCSVTAIVARQMVLFRGGIHGGAAKDQCVSYVSRSGSRRRPRSCPLANNNRRPPTARYVTKKAGARKGAFWPRRGVVKLVSLTRVSALTRSLR